MSKSCGSCPCQAVPQPRTRGRVLLASQVDHTGGLLRVFARRAGAAVEVLAPGLLRVDTDDAGGLLEAAARHLSPVEAAEVRCLVLGETEPTGAAMLLQAMSAPTLATVAARVTHADLTPLFADEQASFRSEYQPIVELGSRRTVAYEALLRATSPTGVVVPPDVLFPAAEAAGWTHLVDRVGRTTALRDAGAWLGDHTLFINFIPTSIYRPEVCLRTTMRAAELAGVRADQIVFEVTEDHRVHDLDHLARVFDYYREHGCRVALDDLGDGYASLNTLVRLRPDVVKLDKALVQSLPGPVGTAVVAAVVSITHAYGGTVLAECVETSEQADAARELGVDLGQGWFFGAPASMPAAALGHRVPART